MRIASLGTSPGHPSVPQLLHRGPAAQWRVVPLDASKAR